MTEQTTEQQAVETVQKAAEAADEAREVVNHPPEQNLVGEARRLQQKAERELKDYKQRLEELEDRDRSELEKAQKRAEKAEQEAQEAASKNKRLERGGWLHSAASEANFHDPSDAVQAANLDDIESERDAKKFVERLASQKKHLVKPDEETTHADKLGRVLKDGKAVAPDQNPENREAALRQQEAGAVLEAIQAAHGGSLPTE